MFLVGKNEQHICSTLSHVPFLLFFGSSLSFLSLTLTLLHQVKSSVAAQNSFESVYSQAKVSCYSQKTSPPTLPLLSLSFLSPSPSSPSPPSLPPSLPPSPFPLQEHLGGKPNVVIANVGCGAFSLLQPSSSESLSPPERKGILGDDLTTFRENLQFTHESLSCLLSDVYEPVGLWW